MKKRKLSLRKKAATAAAIIVAVATLLSGTFAWNSISQSALNEAKASGNNPGGRLHDDFNGVNKDVYIENFGTLAIYARVKLFEYMETGDGAGLKSSDAGYGDKDVTIFKTGADINDWETWSVHKPATAIDDCGLDANGKFHDYWAWTMGGSKVYMPTFNKSKESFKTDYSGSENWGISSAGYNHNVSDPEHGADVDGVGAFLTGLPGSHSQWTAGQTKTDTAYYSDKNQTETHTAKSTLSGSVLTMQQWIDMGSPKGAYWVIDTDGWAYWAQAIEPDTATGLLLNEINLKVEMEEDWYYAIFANAELVSTSDIDLIYGGSDITDSGKDLVEDVWMGGRIVAGDTQYVPLAGSKPLSVTGFDGVIIWSVSPAVAGITIDQKGVVSIDESVPLGTTFTVKAEAKSNPSNNATVACEVVLPVNDYFFPDATFRAYIDTLSGPTVEHAFTKTEAEAITSINVNGTPVEPNTVADVTGIKWFKNLGFLHVRHNLITNMDTSNNKELRGIYANNNNLIELDLTQNTKLVELALFENSDLVTLLLPATNTLKEIHAYENKLEALDVTKCVGLEYLQVNNNQLTSIDVTKNLLLTHLDVAANKLTSLDASKNTSLVILRLYTNLLTEVKVPSTSTLETLNVSNNKLTSLDVSGNTNLTELRAQNNELTTLDISNTKITGINKLWCYYNNMTSLIVNESTQAIFKTSPNTAQAHGETIPNIILSGNKLGDGVTVQHSAPFGSTFIGITYAP